jgi:fumarate hydratase class I
MRRMPEFRYADLLPLGEDTTEYRQLTADGIATRSAFGRDFLEVEPAVLTLLTETAMRDIAHLLRPGHLRQLRSILDDPEASGNDRFVARDLLQNACIAAGGVLPMCQDTGTAIVMGKRGQQVLTDGRDEEHIARGVYHAYTKLNLRYSQLAPLTMWEEKNTGSNLPAQIELYATDGDAYKFLFMAKGGGSANKSYLYQETKAVLSPGAMAKFLEEKIRSTRRRDTWTRCRRPVRPPLTGSATPNSSSRCWRSRAGPGSAPSSAASTSATTSG